MDEALGVVGHVVQPVSDIWVVCLYILLAEPLLKDVCVYVREHHWSWLPCDLCEVLSGAEDYLRKLHLLKEEEEEVDEWGMWRIRQIVCYVLMNNYVNRWLCGCTQICTSDKWRIMNKNGSDGCVRSGRLMSWIDRVEECAKKINRTRILEL